MQTKQNQAMTMSPVFFDPIYTSSYFEEKDGELRICYKDDIWGMKVEENGDVTFKISAPGADKVEVAGIGGSMGNNRIVLDKGENDLFERTVSGIPQGFHYYKWFIDDAEVVNPNAPISYGCFGGINFIDIPREGDGFWLMKDVPHGDVQIHSYVSGVNEHIKKCYVYLPPDYGKDKNKKYPVLYLQHGVGEDEVSWLWNGKLNFIMDNLIAAGDCEEMIVVMCSGYAFPEEGKCVFFPGDFAKELVEYCIPYIESRFAVKKGRHNRAMAGLSLGSAQAIQIVARYQEFFAHLGVFSGVKPDELEIIIQNMDKYPMDTVVLTSGIGEAGLPEGQKKYADAFISAGVVGGQYSYEGYHEWHVWRESLRDFVKLIFAKKYEEDEENFIYKETKLSTEQLDAQTFAEHILMFDPVYKGVIFATDDEGNPAGIYVDEHCGAEIKDAEKGEIVFWYRCRDAKKVQIDVAGHPIVNMEKQEDGWWWKGELSGVGKGFHYYSVKVNGVDVVDQNAPIGYGGFRATNFFEMPEADFEEYRIRQVPHGTVHMNYYHSDETGREKLCYVYTPASYEENTDKKYPVLYIQHGGGENEIGWLWQGKLANIADNLIAAGKMKEMIIVMNTGYALDGTKDCDIAVGPFVKEISDSAVRYIDRAYRTIADKDSRAIAGLSMGAMQSQKVLMEYPDVFAWGGLFSGRLEIRSSLVDYTDILLNKEEFEKRYKLLFVSCGTEEMFYEETKEHEKLIREAGIDIETYYLYGYHDWTNWRHSVVEFLQKLF